MKKILIIILTSVMFLCACERKYSTPDKMIDVIRNESHYSVSEADTIYFAGECRKENYALLWYIIGNDPYNLEYVPAECYITMDNEYIFNQIYSPVDKRENISVFQWHNGYSFLINNPNCKKLVVRRGTDIIELNITQYPFVYYSTLLPDKYDFYDKDGNILTR